MFISLYFTVYKPYSLQFVYDANKMDDLCVLSNTVMSVSSRVGAENLHCDWQLS